MLTYLRAVGDELPVYRELSLAPPLYVVALALGQILQRTNLPSGAIHSLQEFDVLEAIPLESEVGLKAWLERERVRGGLRFMTFGVSAANSNGSAVMGIRTTLLVPESQGSAGEDGSGRRGSEINDGSGGNSNGRTALAEPPNNTKSIGRIFRGVRGPQSTPPRP